MKVRVPRSYPRIGLRLVTTLLLVGTVSAQTTSTQIIGTITDSTGAAVPGVSIQVRRVETGETRGFRTDDTGNYIIPSLEIGEYEITAEATGFQREVRKGIILELKGAALLDFPTLGA